MPEDFYWDQYARRFATQPALIGVKPAEDNKMTICIPAYGEPDLLTTLNSLSLCILPHSFSVEIIILFNKSTYMSPSEMEVHKRSHQECMDWIRNKQVEKLAYHAIAIDYFPDPKGGVGWARKLCMDEAARRLDHAGIIVCLDADCTVEPNYLLEIEAAFSGSSTMDAASIYFEHDYGFLDENARNAIIEYELHLRYLVHAQRWCGFPFAFHTVGSSMAVRRNAYLSQGGMNTRRAGEDFYFLHKFIENSRLFDIKTTCVYPSARLSDRVPFGTGRAMQKLMLDDRVWKTTHFRTFEMIKPLFSSIQALWENLPSIGKDYKGLAQKINLEESLVGYLESIHFLSELALIRSNTGGYHAFYKRFFRYFNAFSMIRYMHFMRDHYNSDVEVDKGANQLFHAWSIPVPGKGKAEDYLKVLRLMDRTNFEDKTD